VNLKVLLTFLFFHQVTDAQAFEFEPVSSSCPQNIDYTHYSVCYSQKFQQAEWTIHLLTKKSIRGQQSRTDDFRPDYRAFPVVSHKAFRGSGFDRGHLVPAADMKLDRQAMSETFFMTNMSPQAPAFNRGIWKSLEYGFRKAVLAHGSAFVVTAPLLTAGLKEINRGISVPDFFYKIAYFPDAGFMMSYLLPNKRMKGQNYRDYAVSVDTLEKLSGIDFFSDLPDELEDQLEKNIY